MSTPDLIARLVSDLAPRPGAPIAARLVAVTTVTSFICLALILALFSKSPHFIHGPAPSIAVTAAGSIALAAGAFWMMVRLTYPENRPHLGWLMVPASILLVGIAFEMGQTSPVEWVQRLLGSNPLGCFFSVLLLSLPVLLGVLLVLREGAPSRPRLTGAMAGLLAGGITSALYTIHCPEDSLLYIAAWHVPAILLVAGLGALSAGRYLRW